MQSVCVRENYQSSNIFFLVVLDTRRSRHKELYSQTSQSDLKKNYSERAIKIVNFDTKILTCEPHVCMFKIRVVDMIRFTNST